MSAQPHLPYGIFWLGLTMLALGILGTCIGKIAGRNGQIVRRSEDPKQYWFCIAFYSVAGLGEITYYLYKAGVFSN